MGVKSVEFPNDLARRVTRKGRHWDGSRLSAINVRNVLDLADIDLLIVVDITDAALHIGRLAGFCGVCGMFL